MTRHRTLHSATTAYMVSSYTSQPGVNLRKKFARNLLIYVVSRAETKFKFKAEWLEIRRAHFVLVLMSPVNNGTMLPEIMQWIKSIFAKAWNRHYGLKGSLWADRYDSEVLVTGMVAQHTPCLALHFAAEIMDYRRHVRRGLRGVTGFARLHRILRR